MKILVTGANGFLGSHVCRQLLDAGHAVRAFVRPTSTTTALAGLAVDQVTGDVTDRASLERAVEGVDSVIHAAADVSDWGRDVSTQMRVNVDGTRHVAQACLAQDVRRLVHVSSVGAIGIPGDALHPADETFHFNLEGSGLTYHLSKRRAEEEVLAQVARGLDAVIVNPSSLKGPDGRHYRGAEIVRSVRRARVVPYFTGGICVVHVEDVARGILAALERGESGERYVLGGDNLSFRMLAERAARAVQLERWFVPFPPVLTGLAGGLLEPWGRMRKRRPRFTYAMHFCAQRFQFYDSAKARTALGYTPRDFDAILEECVRSPRRSR